MQNTFLPHEQFEGAKVLAEIGVKIAAGRAELATLEKDKEQFLEGRAQDAIERVNRVLEGSRQLIGEIGKYHDELVGYRREVEGFLADILYLIERVGVWKAEFDREITLKNREIDQKIVKNDEILAEIRQQRALLEGETEGIKVRREALRKDMVKIRDEWATLGRAKDEIKGKK